LLVFVDADVVLQPGALDRLDAEQAERGGLVSVQPYHEALRPYEKLSLFPNLLALMGSIACTPLGLRLRPAAAFGPVLAIDRAVYDAVGGHGAVRGEVAEDLALARLVDHVTVAGGRGTASFRMYPEGPSSLVEGWTKNLAAGTASTPRWAMVLAVAWVASLAGGWTVSPWCYAASAVQVWWMGRRVGRYGPITAALYAIPLAFFVAVLARSWWCRLTRRPVRWRGRRLSA
jgi:4,4'-diaponeurosporenoate glycosyltransferase